MKITISAVIFFVLMTSAAANASPQYRIPVLLYHHILEDVHNENLRNSSTITPETFELHMAYLHKEGYETITVNELRDYLLNQKVITGKKVLITFDDGYLSNYVYAYDILEKYGFTATIFVITAALPMEPQTFDLGGVTMISIPEMDKSKDIFDFASHTHDMHRVDENNKPFLTTKTFDEIYADISVSYTFQEVDKYFAYPYGAYNRTVIKVLEQTGTELAFTTKPGYVSKQSDRYRLPRYPIHRDLPMDSFESIFKKLE